MKECKAVFLFSFVAISLVLFLVSNVSAEALRISVENPNRVTCEKPVEIKIGRSCDRFVLLDEKGKTVDFQVDDLDGDGKKETLVFLSRNTAGQTREYSFVPHDDMTKNVRKSTFQIFDSRMGSWIPIHIPPTISLSEHTSVPNLSPLNKKKTLQLQRSLQKKRDVINITCPAGKIVLGKANGLIEAAKPAAVIIGGSYLREYSPYLSQGEGELKLVASGPIRAIFHYKGDRISREIYIFRNGLVVTRNKSPELLKNFQIITSCYPFSFCSFPSNTKGIRFSQMIESEFELPATKSLYLYKPGKTALGVMLSGLRPYKEAIWADGGELSYEVGLQLIKQQGVKSYLKKMGELCEPYIGGMIRIDDCRPEDKTFSIQYDIVNDNADSKTYFKSLKPFVVTFEKTEMSPKIVGAPVSDHGLESELTIISNRVTRLYPNKGHGWKLRPYVLSKVNPLPGYYDVFLKNTSTQPIEVTLEIPADEWISIVSVSELIGKRKFGTAQMDLRSEELPFRKENKKFCVVLKLAAGQQKTFSIRLAPMEETLGDYKSSLFVKWPKGQRDHELFLTVVPNIPSFTISPGDCPYDYWIIRKFGFTVGYKWLPTYYMEADGSFKPKIKKHFINACRDMERHGLFFVPDMALRATGYIKSSGMKKRGEKVADPTVDVLASLSFEEFAPRLEEFVKDVNASLPKNFIAYWGHDEIWELFKKDTCTIDQVKLLDEAIIRAMPHPLVNTIMPPGIDAGLHKVLPTDIPMSFYYSGRDGKFQKYAKELRRGYVEIFNSWKRNNTLRSKCNDKKCQPLSWFFISGMKHVTNYVSMRRQAWWLINNGYSGISYWALFSSVKGGILYANGVGCHALMMTDRKNGFVPTDRAFAMMDISADMELITELKIRKANLSDRKLLNKIGKWERNAYKLSQENKFDDAVLAIQRAILLSKGGAEDHATPRSLPAAKSIPEEKMSMKDLMASGIPNMTIPKVGQHRPAPVIDGELDNSFLEDAYKVNSFVLNTGKGLPSQQTQVYLLYDDKNLYLYFECFDKDTTTLKASLKNRDDALWKDDCVEVFLAPEEGNYFHMAVNPLGVKYDKSHPGDDKNLWNPDWQVKAKTQKGSWTVEMAIPFSSLGVHKPVLGETWRINLCRECPKTREASCWSKSKVFHNPSKFGVAVFGK